MKLYETSFNDGRKYYERYYDTELKKSVKSRILEDYEHYLPDSNGKYTSILDDNLRLSKHTGSGPKEAYGKITPDYLNIRNNYWDKDNSRYNLTPRKWYWDIETTAIHGEINSKTTPEEVVMFQIYDTLTNTMTVFSYKDWFYRSKFAFNKFEYDVNFVECNTEEKLFNAFFDLLEEQKPLMVIGWNTAGFDNPYIFNRAYKIGLDNQRMSPFGKVKISYNIGRGGMDTTTLTADGIEYIDLYDVYRNFVMAPRSNYSLDNIAEVELGHKKIDHSEYASFDGFRTGKDYIMPSEEPDDHYDKIMYKAQKAKREDIIFQLATSKFIAYGIVDTYLVKLIDDKLNLTNIMMIIASSMGVNLSNSLATLKPWGQFIENVALLENKVLPPRVVENGLSDDEYDSLTEEQKEDYDKKQYAQYGLIGGYVRDPQVGKHRWIMSGDVTSMYPKLGMVASNMSPETYLPPERVPEELRLMRDKYFNDEDESKRIALPKEILLEYSKLLKKYNISAGVSGALFHQEFQGIIPKLVEQIFSTRKKFKKSMFEYQQLSLTLDKGSKEYIEAKAKEQEANVRQLVEKTKINGLYGALTAKYFKLFNIEIGRAITANGRFFIQLLARNIENELQRMLPSDKEYILYGDTDSVYFHIEPFIVRKYGDSKYTPERVTWADAFEKKIIAKITQNTIDEFNDYLNAYDPSSVGCDREVISDAGVFLAKKKYFLRVRDNEGTVYPIDEPYMKAMGLELAQGGTSPFAKKYLKESLNIILDKSEADIANWVKDIKKEFSNLPLMDIAKTQGITKVYDPDWGKIINGRKKTIPFNSKCALGTNKYITQNALDEKYHKIKAGDKAKMLYLKTPNKLYNVPAFAFNAEEFAQLFKDEIDYDMNFEKYFTNALDNMLVPLGINIHKSTEEIDEW